MGEGFAWRGEFLVGSFLTDLLDDCKCRCFQQAVDFSFHVGS